MHISLHLHLLVPVAAVHRDDQVAAHVYLRRQRVVGGVHLLLHHTHAHQQGSEPVLFQVFQHVSLMAAEESVHLHVVALIEVPGHALQYLGIPVYLLATIIAGGVTGNHILEGFPGRFTVTF